LGDLVRERRRELELRLCEAARVIGVSTATIKNWEAGRAAIGDASFPKVIRFLGRDPNAAPTSLSERVRAARKATGLSQKGLALSLGLDPSTIRAWEAGQVGYGHERVREALEAFIGAVAITPAWAEAGRIEPETPVR
jgi:DNA-binding transcriptional regulator YiaG